MRRKLKLIGGLGGGAVFLAAAAAVYALSASSAGYRLTETQAAAKGIASSASYKLYSSTGQPAPGGFSSSVGYQDHSGFLRRAFFSAQINQPPSINAPTQVNILEQSNLTFAPLSFEESATDPEGTMISLGPVGFIGQGVLSGATFVLTQQTPTTFIGTLTWSQTITGSPISFSNLRRCYTSYPATFQAWDGTQGTNHTVTVNLLRCGDPGNTLCTTPQPHSPMAIAYATPINVVGPEDPFGLFAGDSCDVDNAPMTSGLSYLWSYLGSVPTGHSAPVQNPTSASASSTAPNVTESIQLQYQVVVTDSTSRTDTTQAYVAVFPGCVIATAAYGSALAPDVGALRSYRDTVLMRSRLGRTFVRCYYHISPPVARVIATWPVIRAAVRQALQPLVALVRRLTASMGD